MVTIYYVNIKNIDDSLYILFYSVVSEDRRIKTKKYKFMDDRKRSVCSEILLEYAISKSNEESLIEKGITYNKYGKPYIGDFYFNISHSGKWVVVACSNEEIGIDIEKIQKQTGVEMYFTEEERRYINEASDSEKGEIFTKIWTLKESYLKYIGTGLFKKLDSFSILFNKGDILCHDIECENIELKSYLFEKDYYCSICSKEKGIKFEEVKISDLICMIRKKEMLRQCREDNG